MLMYWGSDTVLFLGDLDEFLSLPKGRDISTEFSFGTGCVHECSGHAWKGASICGR